MPPKRKNSSATQQPPAKRTRSSLSKRPNYNLGRTNRTSNQTHESSTRGPSRRRRAAATPSGEVNRFGLSAVTSITNPFAIEFIAKSWNIRSSRGVNQLSNALQHLTSSMQANNTPATGNAESTRIIEDGTPNDQPPLTVENSTPKCRLHRCLIRGLRTTATGYLIRFYTVSSPYLYVTYCITWSPPRCVTTTSTPKD